MNIKIPRGTFDITSDNMRMRQQVLKDIFSLAEGYGFEQIQTPIFESTGLFKRSVGDETDIVSKEMYTFNDKKEREMTLRPELTAPVVRSYIENKFYATNQNLKAFYYGPAFRYERPQAGRYRQFHQFGVESFNTRNPYHDAEIISLAYSILKHFNLNDKVVLKINSLGQKEERLSYVKSLKEHLINKQTGEKGEFSLCDDCKMRLELNPLRVLDCKEDSTKKIMKTAPKLLDSIGSESKDYFNTVLKTLNELEIPYEIDNCLVRGLDYYNDTVFEFVLNTSKAQGTIIGGGRYDGLVGKLNGPDTPAFGFGMGIERLIEAIKENNPTIIEEFTRKTDVYYMPLCEEAELICVKSMAKLRFEGVRCEYAGAVKSIKANFKQAEKLQAVFAVIIGKDEVENNYVTIRNLVTRDEEKVNLEDFEKERTAGEENEH